VYYILLVIFYDEPDIRQDIRPEIRYPALFDIPYPAFRLARYPVKSVPRASLVINKVLYLEPNQGTMRNSENQWWRIRSILTGSDL
jgi:hypothetical protein